MDDKFTEKVSKRLTSSNVITLRRLIKNAENAWDVLRKAKHDFNDFKDALETIGRWEETCKAAEVEDPTFEDCGA